MQYQKKGENPDKNKTDSAYERPATSRGGRRGGRGGAKEEKPAREVIEQRDDKPRGGKATRGDHKDDGVRGGRGKADAPRGGRGPTVDENSWQWRYKNEKRPTYEQITVTIDTVLPELPTETKSKPSRDEFDRQMK